MLGERSGQKGPWDADHSFWTPMGRNTSQVLLTSWRGRLFCKAVSSSVGLLGRYPYRRAGQRDGYGVAIACSRQGERR